MELRLWSERARGCASYFARARFFGDAGVARIAPWAWEEHPIGEGCTAELMASALVC